MNDCGLKSSVALVQKDLDWLQRLLHGLLHLRSTLEYA
jgi:hypothetical protein